MGCRELDITDFYRLTPTPVNPNTRIPGLPGTSENPYSRFKPVVSVSVSIYRYYSPEMGRWLSREKLGERASDNLLSYVFNSPIDMYDVLGLFGNGRRYWQNKYNREMYRISNDPLIDIEFDRDAYVERIAEADRGRKGFPGHSDFEGGDEFDYTAEDHDPWTDPWNLKDPRGVIFGGVANHFQSLIKSLNQVNEAIEKCDKENFERKMHRMQDFWSHYKKGYRWNLHKDIGLYLVNSGVFFANKAFAPSTRDFGIGHAFSGREPDEDVIAWEMANIATKVKLSDWYKNCCKCTSPRFLKGYVWNKRATGPCDQ